MRIVHINLSAESNTGKLAIDLCRMSEKAGHSSLFCYADGQPPEDIASYLVGSHPNSDLPHEVLYSIPKSRNKFLRTIAGYMHHFARRVMSSITLPLSYLRRKTDRYTHMVLCRVTDRAGFYSKYATRQLIKVLKSYKPDIIHLHTLHGYYLNLPILFRFIKENDIPTVFSLYDCWAYTGHCLYYSAAENAIAPDGEKRRHRKSTPGCSRWKTGCGKCACKHEYPSSLLLDNSAKNWSQKRSLYSEIPHMVLTVTS